jgi:hypothetical protein
MCEGGEKDAMTRRQIWEMTRQQVWDRINVLIEATRTAETTVDDRDELRKLIEEFESQAFQRGIQAESESRILS